MRPEDIGRRLRAGQLIGDDDFETLDASGRALALNALLDAGRRGGTCARSTLPGCVQRARCRSGAGKFCVVGALSTDLSFTGVEQRTYLVDAARTLARSFGVVVARGSCTATLDAVDCCRFDALYFYNPLARAWRSCQPFDEKGEFGRATLRSRQSPALTMLTRMRWALMRHVLVTCGDPRQLRPGALQVSGVSLLRLWRKARWKRRCLLSRAGEYDAFATSCLFALRGGRAPRPNEHRPCQRCEPSAAERGSCARPMLPHSTAERAMRRSWKSRLLARDQRVLACSSPCRRTHCDAVCRNAQTSLTNAPPAQGEFYPRNELSSSSSPVCRHGGRCRMVASW